VNCEHQFRDQVVKPVFIRIPAGRNADSMHARHNSSVRPVSEMGRRSGGGAAEWRPPLPRRNTIMTRQRTVSVAACGGQCEGPTYLSLVSDDAAAVARNPVPVEDTKPECVSMAAIDDLAVAAKGDSRDLLQCPMGLRRIHEPIPKEPRRGSNHAMVRSSPRMAAVWANIGAVTPFHRGTIAALGNRRRRPLYADETVHATHAGPTEASNDVACCGIRSTKDVNGFPSAGGITSGAARKVKIRQQNMPAAPATWQRLGRNSRRRAVLMNRNVR